MSFCMGKDKGHIHQFKHNTNLGAQYEYGNLFVHDIEKKTPVDYITEPHAILGSTQVAAVWFCIGIKRKGGHKIPRICLSVYWDRNGSGNRRWIRYC